MAQSCVCGGNCRGAFSCALFTLSPFKLRQMTSEAFRLRLAVGVLGRQLTPNTGHLRRYRVRLHQRRFKRNSVPLLMASAFAFKVYLDLNHDASDYACIILGNKKARVGDFFTCPYMSYCVGYLPPCRTCPTAPYIDLHFHTRRYGTHMSYHVGKIHTCPTMCDISYHVIHVGKIPTCRVVCRERLHVGRCKERSLFTHVKNQLRGF